MISDSICCDYVIERNRAIPSPLPTSSHWAPPSASSLWATPWSRPAPCSTSPPPVGSLVPSPWQSLHGHLFCRWCNNPICTHKTISLITLFLKNSSLYLVQDITFPTRSDTESAYSSTGLTSDRTPSLNYTALNNCPRIMLALAATASLQNKRWTPPALSRTSPP